MAKTETDIVHAIQVDVSPFGCRLFKNIRGGAYPIGYVKPLLAAIFRADWTLAAKLARSLRMIMMGLQAPGASDLIGYMPVLITPEMVGNIIPVFVAIEVKTEIGKTDADGKQDHFIGVIHKIGGYSGVARCKNDARKIMRIPVDMGHDMP